MSEKRKETALVLEQTEIAADIFSMYLKTETIAKNALPGQFIALYCEDASRMLPRPISLCEINKEEGILRIVYRIAGEGTREFSKLEKGMTVDILGPLGNGYTPDRKKAFVIGGGIGIPPMLQLAKELNCEKQMILGYRDELFLKEEFDKLGEVYVATESGAHGTQGNVIDAIKENALEADVIYACGPMPMLRGLKAYAQEHNMECFISLEERMACGVGACLGCVTKSKEKDHHTNVHNKRICVEGPVFDAKEVEI